MEIYIEREKSSWAPGAQTFSMLTHTCSSGCWVSFLGNRTVLGSIGFYCREIYNAERKDLVLQLVDEVRKSCFLLLFSLLLHFAPGKFQSKYSPLP
jgi:hypothetical protein